MFFFLDLELIRAKIDWLSGICGKLAVAVLTPSRVRGTESGVNNADMEMVLQWRNLQ